MDGVIIVNKPKGYTSHDIVNVLRKKLNMKKIGHTGTLDPNATGVLPILIGNATKLSKYLIEHNKTYVATIQLGKKTTTGDLEGEVIEEKQIPNLDKEKIISALNSFIGKQKQIPPVYSAIKINGKKAYEYARKGQAVELEPRDIEIFDIAFIEYENDKITFEVSCSKGTYIRVLCEDIATKLDTIGYMKNLIRTKVDKFDIKDSIEIDNINESSVISIEKIFKENKSINLENEKLKLFLNGVLLTQKYEDGLYKIYSDNQFIGFGIIKNKLLKRDVIVI